MARVTSAVPKARKRQIGRGSDLLLSHVRVFGTQLSDADREYIRTKIGEKFRKAAGKISRLSLRVRDINGPKGGVDHVCRIKIMPFGLQPVVVEERSTRLRTAVDEALRTAERTLVSTLSRRRTKPIRDVVARRPRQTAAKRV
ncbi:MAG TPA: HPF/RaiA family ribosome-associated protein [Vicinamibacterales bacterium]